MEANLAVALVLSAMAGLSTTVGSLAAIFWRKPGMRFMSLVLCFSAGVMLLLSFMELLPGGIEALGFVPAYAAFFTGIAVMFLLDVTIPHQYMAEHSPAGERNGGLTRTAILLALGIGIHNRPEGMATLTGALQDVSLGAAIALAVALHNIPEGLAVSMPSYSASGSRSKAFLWSFLAGVAEPVGAAVAAVVLLPILNDAVLGLFLSAVAGVMVFSSPWTNWCPSLALLGRHTSPSLAC
ncbi:MAG TPA: ZIP family metal transporter [Anaerolineae bacterium]|nr:ZIP family metal transporter [Anaerolineae bacterium]